MKLRLGLIIVSLFFAGIVIAADPAEDDTASAASDTNRLAARLAWHRKVLVDGYNTTGSRNPAWDEAAREALDEWAHIRADSSAPARVKRVTAALQRAKDASCDDPLIAYISLKFLDNPAAGDAKANAKLVSKVGLNLSLSGYSDWLKFYGHLRAAQAFSNAYSLDTNAWNYFISALVKARPALVTTLEEGSVPIEDAYAAAHELLASAKATARIYTDFYTAIEAPLFKNYAKHHLPWLLKADYYVGYAWKARGNATAEKVAESAWPLFTQRLETAAEAIDAAWKINQKDARIPIMGIRIENGRGKGMEVMETWFKRAMTIDPASYSACFAKMNYLEPKWFGSPEAMISFGRQCVVSREFKGRVPLILANAHSRLSKYAPKEERNKYWTQPGVWKDLRASYETYLAAQPAAHIDRAEYLRYAELCGQWAEYVSLVKKLDSDTRASVATVMGGQDEFESQLDKAKQKASANKD